MSVFSIAFNNFKNNIKTYSMFFISMIFSVIILSNFLILMNGEALKVLGEANADYTKMILQMISIILGLFMLLFIWYVSNVFLKNRKKEIGLFTFMGVDLKTIGKIYFTQIDTEKISEEITKVLGEKEFELDTDVLMVNNTLENVDASQKQAYIVMSYDEFTDVLKTTGYEKDLEKINENMVKEDNVIYIENPNTLVSLIKPKEITIADKTFKISEGDIRFKVLGSLIKSRTIVVNNDEYERLNNDGQRVNFYGIKVKNDSDILNEDIINKLGEGLAPYLNGNIKFQVGKYETQRVEWLKLIYAIGAFLFLVFVLAEASIIYIKIYSDATEDKDKYKILKDIGASKKDLGKAIRKEVRLFYVLPLSIGLVHSYFAIHVLGKFLSENLNVTFIISAIVSVSIFVVSSIVSTKSFKNIVN